MKLIDVRLQDEIIFSNEHGTIIANDMYFSFFKEGDSQKILNKTDISQYPEVHISGFDKLFHNDVNIANTMAHFASAFRSNNGDDWNLTYNAAKNYIVAQFVGDTITDDFDTTFQLSYMFNFTGNFSDKVSIKVNFKFIGFQNFFQDCDNEYDISRIISPIEEPYVDKIMLYNQADEAVTAIHKGEKAIITWSLGNVEKVSAFLYDENGTMLINIPPYETREPIMTDTKFTLKLQKDGYYVSKELPVYRTLWKNETKNIAVLKHDIRGNNKFFKNGSGYYIYIHPKLLYSKDLIKWEEKAKYDSPPENFKSYSCSFSNSYSEAIICYNCDDKVILREYRLRDNRWTNETVYKGGDFFLCRAEKMDGEIRIIGASQKEIRIYSSLNNEWRFLNIPENTDVISMDTFWNYEGNRKGDMFVSVLCNDQHVYLFNIDKDLNDNIYEFERSDQKNVYLVKSNSLYTVLDSYVFELNDKEKYIDLHFSPKDNTEGTSADTPMILGAVDDYTFAAIVNAKEKDQEKAYIWKYKF